MRLFIWFNTGFLQWNMWFQVNLNRIDLVVINNFYRWFLIHLVSITAIDVEANGVSHLGTVTNNTLNNGYSEKKPDPPKSDPIQSAMGSLGRWHIFVCAFIFLLKFPVAWHQMSIIFTAPNINYTCADPNVTDRCSADCTVS